MQKSANIFLKNFFSLFVRGVIIGIVALIVFLWGVFAVAHANSGGRFGEILNKILASGNWEKDTTGTVKNAQNLGGKPASEYQQIKWPNQTCNPGTCMVGFHSDGTINCK